jgi:MFS family permease
MNKILFWSFSVALAGFLFGFDTIVISGADQKLQGLWKTSDVFHGFVVMASALWGTVAGAITGGIPTNKYGRKNTLIGIAVLYFVSALGAALANDPIRLPFSDYRRVGNRRFNDSSTGLHLRNCTSSKKRTARGHVSIEHCRRHPDGIPV